MMLLAQTPIELDDFRPGDRRAVVMTMGALHAGHAQLFQDARTWAGSDGVVVATIFVNPLQFGPTEDFDKYPRTLDDDLEVCRAAGVDVVFHPKTHVMYASDSGVTIEPGPLGDVLEGRNRPGHFRGVLTVVAKLLNITRAEFALFGEKDYQQLTLIRHMVDDLFMPVRIIGVPTVREPDGLAMSSRNRYLTPDERHQAALIPRALQEVVQRAVTGDIRAAENAGLEMLQAAGIESIDYLTIRGANLGEPQPGAPARVLAAAHVGSTRLLDNMPCVVGDR